MGYAYLSGYFAIKVFFMWRLPTPCAPSKTKVRRWNVGSPTDVHNMLAQCFILKSQQSLYVSVLRGYNSPGTFTTSSYVTRSSWSKTALCFARYLSRHCFFLRLKMEQLTARKECWEKERKIKRWISFECHLQYAPPEKFSFL